MISKHFFKKLVTTGLISGLTGMLMLVAAKFIIDHQYQRTAQSVVDFYPHCQKVWAHRGLTQNAEQNSITAMNQAFKAGAKGVEVDIRYDETSNQYIVARDFPYPLIEGEVLTLDKLFSKTGQTRRQTTDGYYWLDHKTLADASPQIAKASIDSLKALLDKHQLSKQIVVESWGLENLARANQAGLNTSMLILNLEKDTDLLRFYYRLYKLKLYYILSGGFDAFSMSLYQFTPEILDKLAPVPMLVFTENDPSTLQALIDNPQIKVVLSDQPFYTLQSKHHNCKHQEP